MRPRAAPRRSDFSCACEELAHAIHHTVHALFDLDIDLQQFRLERFQQRVILVGLEQQAAKMRHRTKAEHAWARIAIELEKREKRRKKRTRSLGSRTKAAVKTLARSHVQLLLPEVCPNEGASHVQGA